MKNYRELTPLRRWHIYTALAFMSYHESATPFTAIFILLAVVCFYIEVG